MTRRTAPLRLAILISGRGSNMLAIARACAAGAIDAQVAGVIADRADAAGLTAARGLGLEAFALPARDFATRAAFEAALGARLDALRPELVILAGFMRILGAGFVARYTGRMLNIHPSLLPAFPGLATHRRALQAGVAVHGATVHFVGTEVDGGPIVAQAAVPVQPDDDEAKLSARVLDAEHRLYPMVVRWFVEDRLRLDGTRVRLAEPRPGESRLLWSDAR